ncbi:MAG: PilZ domain-containing protein [Candidatus Omnitrophica bacterium]|nr:PilZ domain-containing protein [Candidatus Omnitrophota bacterium]
MGNFGWDSRKWERVRFEVQGFFRLNRLSRTQIGLREKTVSAKFLDVSEGGCGLESPSFIPGGVRLNIFVDRNFLLPSAKRSRKRRFAKMAGVVRYCSQLVMKRYRLGIQFERVSRADRELIRDYVERNKSAPA